MSLPKDPRQAMITMMYLVLIALLAMNVSSSLLKSFRMVDISLVEASVEQDKKVANALDAIKGAYESDPEKKSVQKVWGSAQEVEKATEAIKKLLTEVKDRTIELGGGYVDQGHGVEELKNASDDALGMQIMEFEGKGVEVREGMNKCRAALIEILKKHEADTSMVKIFDEMPEKVKMNDAMLPWHVQVFQGMPAAAVLPTITQLENQVKAAEIEMYNFLRSKIGLDEIRVDRVAPLVVSETSLLGPGQDYESEIFVSAWNSTQLPEVYVGKVKPDLKEKYKIIDEETKELVGYSKILKEGDENFWPLANKDVKPLEINQWGRGVYKFTAGSGTGVQNYEGAIKMKKPNGDIEWYIFEKEYKVVEVDATPVVSPTKMNVMYIGVDNPISVSVPGFQPGDVNAGISEGTLKNEGGGNYIARVKKAGTVNITVSVKDKAGEEKKLPSSEFRVKRVPDPVPKLGSVSAGNVPTGTFKAQRGLIADLENFDFDLRFNVVSYEIIIQIPRKDPIAKKIDGPAFPDDVVKLISNVKPGTQVIFMDIKVKGPDGIPRKLPSIAYKLI